LEPGGKLLPDFQNLPFDILIVSLRFIFVFLIYFFLYQVVRVITRDISRVQPVAAAAEAAGDDGPLGQLVVVQPGKSGLRIGQSLPLLAYTTMGRRQTNTIPLEDDFISGEHSILSLREDGNWWLEDGGSTNGTYLNGKRIDQPTPVGPGDLVGVGRVELRINY